MTADSQWAMQKAVFDALRGDAALQGLTGQVPSRVFDHVPQGLWRTPDADGRFPPYLVIGFSTARDFDSKTENGCEQTLMVHTWSRYRGFREIKEIMAAVVDILDRQDLSVAGHNLIQLRFEFSDTFIEDDGLTRHGVQRFRALTEASP